MKVIIPIVFALALVIGVFAQPTGFNYQGSLTDGGNPANGNFLMQFKLFDAVAGGAQIGTTIADLPVTVTAGGFNALLDFGTAPLSGANRWLEIAVRRNSGESYVTLSPREQISSSPYSVRTLSAAMADDSQKLGGVNASDYVTTTAGGTSFIRNQATPQAASNFNISGSGVVNGNLGVGTTASGVKFGVTSSTATAGNNTAFFAAPAIGPNASNIHFGTTGDWYVRSANAAGKVILQDTGGTVGIGTTSPTHTLDVNGFFRASHAAGGNVVSETSGGVNSWAKLWARTPAQSWSVGTSHNFNGNQLYFANENSGLIQMAIMPSGNVGIGHTNPPAKLWVDGHVGQRDSSYGLPKAMLLVRENGFGAPSIERCYNAVTQNLTPPCNISVTQPGGAGLITVSFSFRVTDRFISLTPFYASTLSSFAHVAGFDQGDISGGSIRVYAHGFQSDPADFYMIVY